MFPSELLIAIFYLVGPSTPRNPYPYLPLRLVCRHWRDILESDARFWTALYFKLSVRPHFDLHDEVVRRSKSHGLDIFLSPKETRDPDINLLVFRIIQFIHANSLQTRIKTLLLPKLSYHLSYTSEKLAMLHSPQLERITGTLNMGKACLINLIVHSRLRYAELPWSTLLDLQNQGLLDYLSHIEWLKLGQSDLPSPDIPVNRIHDILEGMPNLQILILSWKKYQRYANEERSRPVITLPKLRLLSMNLNPKCGDLWTFHATNLDYFSALDLGKQDFQNWQLLDGLHLSKINSLLIKIEPNTSEGPFEDEPGIQHIACVSGSKHTLLDCSMFEDFHYRGLDSLVAVNDRLELPPKNCFHIPICWTMEPHKFIHILERTTNLVELTLNYGAFDNGPSFSLFLSRLLTKGCTTITQLNVTQGRSFVETCTILKNGLTVPRLERLMYQNASKMKSTSFIPGRVKALQDVRLKAGSQPLKVLDLRNFANIPPSRVQEIEDTGVQLIQRNS